MSPGLGRIIGKWLLKDNIPYWKGGKIPHRGDRGSSAFQDCLELNRSSGSWVESILSSIEMKMQESQIDKVLNSASQRQKSTMAWGHHGALETQLSVTSNVFFQEVQQVTGGFPTRMKKQNHEERNIRYTQDIKVSKLPTVKIYKWCSQGLVIIGKRRVFTDAETWRHIVERRWNQKILKSKDFKREIRVPSLLLDFAWIAWNVSWIPSQGNLTCLWPSTWE